MANSIKIKHDKPVRFLMGSSAFSPVYSYVDGKKTDEQLKGENGLPLWQALRSRAEIFGEVLDEATIVVESALKPEIKETGLLTSHELLPPIELSIRARSSGNAFADLAVKISGNLKQSSGGEK